MSGINLFHLLWLCVAAMMAAVFHLYVSHLRTMRRLEEALRGRRAVAADAVAETPLPPQEPVRAVPPPAPAPAAAVSPVERLAGLDALGPRPAPGAGIGAALVAGARGAAPAPEKAHVAAPAVDLFGDSSMDDEEQRVTSSETAAPDVPAPQEPAPAPRANAAPRDVPPERLPRGMDGNLPKFSAAAASTETSLDSLFDEVDQGAAAPAPAPGRGGLLMQRLSEAAPLDLDDSRNVESTSPPEPVAEPAPPVGEVTPAPADRAVWERLEKLAKPEPRSGVAEKSDEVGPSRNARDPLEAWARGSARAPEPATAPAEAPPPARPPAAIPDGWGPDPDADGDSLLEAAATARAASRSGPESASWPGSEERRRPARAADPVEVDEAAGWGPVDQETIDHPVEVEQPAPAAATVAPESHDDAWALAFRSSRKPTTPKDAPQGDDLFNRRLSAQLAMLTDARDEVDRAAAPTPEPQAPLAPVAPTPPTPADPRTEQLRGREQLLERFYSFYQSVVDESAHRQEKPRSEPAGEVFRRVLEKARGAGVAAERGEADGESLLATGRFDEAAAWFRARVEAGTATEDDFRQLGRALANAGKMDEAVATWEQMLKRYPDARGGLAGLGELLAGAARPRPTKKLSFRKKSV